MHLSSFVYVIYIPACRLFCDALLWHKPIKAQTYFGSSSCDSRKKTVGPYVLIKSTHWARIDEGKMLHTLSNASSISC